MWEVTCWIMIAQSLIVSLVPWMHLLLLMTSKTLEVLGHHESLSAFWSTPWCQAFCHHPVCALSSRSPWCLGAVAPAGSYTLFSQVTAGGADCIARIPHKPSWVAVLPNIFILMHSPTEILFLGSADTWWKDVCFARRIEDHPADTKASCFFTSSLVEKIPSTAHPFFLFWQQQSLCHVTSRSSHVVTDLHSNIVDWLICLSLGTIGMRASPCPGSVKIPVVSA